MTSTTEGRQGGLGLARGTAIYVGAVLGPGVLALPALGAAVAGPASILSWAALVALSAPVALCFARLAAEVPDAGGISSFVARAWGLRPAAVVGWWFYAAVPVGIVAGAQVGGAYVAAAYGLDPPWVQGVAALLLAVSVTTSYLGVRVSGSLQLVLVAVLVVVLVATVVVASPHVTAARFHPFVPNGWTAVASATVVLFYAVTGWEAASHLSADFTNPSRDLPRVAMATLGVVATVYAALVVTVIGVLGNTADTSAAPVLDVLLASVGDVAKPVTAVVAVLLTLGALNAFVVGGGRLGAALGRDGAMPAWLAGDSPAAPAPRRSLTIQLVMTGVVHVTAVAANLELDALMSATSALLAAVTTAGMLAGARLLTGHYRWLAVVGAGASAIVLTLSGRFLLLPLLLAAAAAATVGRLARRQRLGYASS